MTESRIDLRDGARRLHFMGAGGAGMSALAEIALASGHGVSGCDLKLGAVTDRLEELGARIEEGHAADHLTGVDAVVVSAAVPTDHPELEEARTKAIPVIRRAELLASLMEGRRGIAVAGTHGKSTTTAMVGRVFEAAGLDPTVIVGGRIRNQGGNVRIGYSDWVVAEADEYDRAFLALRPAHAVVNNIEADHLDVYGTIEGVQEAFGAFVNRIAEGGALALGVDDPGARRLPLPEGRRVVRFGLGEGTDVRGTRVRTRELETVFDLLLEGEAAGEVRLRMPGRHNVRNALGAAAIACAVGVEVPAILSGLGEVRGVERRFEIVHRDDEIVIVDDYAHHPTEVEATLSSARLGWPKRRLVAVFQPHLYSRTRDFAEAFGEALCGADVVYVTDVYPARERPIPGVTGELVAEAARQNGATDVTHLSREVDALEMLDGRLRPGDVLVTLGAGDIDQLASRLAGTRAARNPDGAEGR